MHISERTLLFLVLIVALLAMFQSCVNEIAITDIERYVWGDFGSFDSLL
jgi:hypothetical protein